MRYLINEIFYSLQGEGFHTGVPAVFIRFSGCNLHCYFCDTPHQSGSQMTLDEIIEEVLHYPQCRLIVLTGGEPSLFIDEAFVWRLKSATQMKIAIETNGTHPLPKAIDWVTLSPKSEYRGGAGAAVVVKKCDELKIIYTGQPLEPYFQIEAAHYFLQPCFLADAQESQLNRQQTVEAILADPRWRLSLQIHRTLAIR